MDPRQAQGWRARLQTSTWPAEPREDSAPATVPGLTVLFHPDPQRTGERALLPSLSSGRGVRLSRLEPAFALPGETTRRPLADPRVSRRPLSLLPDPEAGVRIVRGESPTPVTADGEPVHEERTFTAAEVDRGVVLLLAERIVVLLHRLRPVFERGLPHHGLVGESDVMLDIRRQILRVADLDVPVLLKGETGTGKELVAVAIHRASARRERPYLAINMSAMPATLAAAELFGAARGAFTGADRRRPGYFSRADGGTLFLDEIGEVPLEVQPLLLRALENGEIQPVGSEEILRVKVRTIAATDSDLDAAIAADRFRAPLLHRLSGYEIHLPSLRQRRDDFGRLLLHFLRQELAAVGESDRLADPGPDGSPWLPAPLVARLAAHPWPGNVRQLRNVARHLAIDSRGAAEARIGPQLERLLLAGEPRRPEPSTEADHVRKLHRSPREISDDELVAALKTHNWDPGAAARHLGISRPALYALIDSCPRTRKAADLERQEIERAAELDGGRLAAMAQRLEVSEEGLKRRMKRLGLR